MSVGWPDFHTHKRKYKLEVIKGTLGKGREVLERSVFQEKIHDERGS